MLIACKCLNVSIDVSGNRLPDVVVDVRSLNLSRDEESESFFREKLSEVVVNRVTAQVESLVQSKTVGDWTIGKCLNCSTSTHATGSNRGLGLVNASMLTHPDDVELAKTSKNYSPIFRIVIEPESVERNPPDSRQSPQKIQTALTSLQQQLNTAIREQVTKTEEKIRLFTEQQYNLLEEFRENATRDHKALAQRIYEAQPRLDAEPVPSEADVSITEPHGASSNRKVVNRKRTDAVPIDSSQVSDAKTRSPTTRSLNQLSRTSTPGLNSLDSEGLFVLEGMEESVVHEAGHSEGESDTDHDDSGSHDEGIDVHRKRTSSFHMAKSLPVNVPVYAVTAAGFDNDDESLGTVDIAASIKALARSVHGDAIFGDLPRPRFSTQI